jgi:hypothetical protein
MRRIKKVEFVEAIGRLSVMPSLLSHVLLGKSGLCVSGR